MSLSIIARAAAPCLAVILLLGVAACGPTDAATAEDVGDFKVRPAELTSDTYDALVATMTADRVLEDIAEELNATFILPEDIGLRFQECDEDNAYYDPEDRTISLCLEMFEAARELMADQYETAAELEAAVNGSFLFTVYHEVGHALVDAFDIPITGREEDAVDQLAAWWLIDNDTGDQAAIAGALSFYTDPESAELDESDFADEHSLNQQRFYNLTCWVYGSNPTQYQALLEDEWLTAARAEQCEAEFETLNTSWYALLNDHLKE